MEVKMEAVIALYLLVAVLNASEIPEWHMKPLGSHVKPDPVDETFADNLITAEDFANKYVLPRKPIVFRGIVKEWPAFDLWTDEYLKDKYGEMEMRLEAKKEKQGMIPKGDVCLGRDRLKTFLNEYNKGADKYVVSELPTPMWHEVLAPPPMACGELLTNYVEIDLWVNSDTGKKGKGGNSILHKDAFNTVNCVLNGTKEWKLIELQYNDYVYQSWEGAMDAGYGGFSLVNPEKVDAKEHPNVGKIPRWQFVTVNAGDCLHLPSQMWHQVKSYGATNRAVAFLFSQFNDKDAINTTGCEASPRNVPLSDVDVDLQYPGNGTMTMGHSSLEDTRQMLMELVDEKTGLITPRSTYRFVYRGHANGAINKALFKKKTLTLYKLLKSIAGEDVGKMTEDLIQNLSRDEIRSMFTLILPIEPAADYTHEYSAFTPEEVGELINTVLDSNNGILEKEKLMNVYEDFGGTHDFAKGLWERLAGDKEEVNDVNANITAALYPYEYYRRDVPDPDEDEEATITTPQGHVSQPRKMRGGYSADKAGEERDEESSEKSEGDQSDGRNGEIDEVDEGERGGKDESDTNIKEGEIDEIDEGERGGKDQSDTNVKEEL